MRQISLEAGADLLEGLVLVAEEGEGRLVAVLFGVFRMEVWRLVARPVENDEVLVLGVAESCGRSRERRGQPGRNHEVAGTSSHCGSPFCSITRASGCPLRPVRSVSGRQPPG